MLILPQPQSLMIAQEELLLWFGYRSQIAVLRRQQADLEERIRQRLERGASCEPGPHLAEIQERQTRAGKLSRLVIL